MDSAKYRSKFGETLMNNAEQNLALTREWERLYNEDAERMATDCYASDCVVTPMGGASIRGNEALRQLEIEISKVAPTRLMRVDHRHAAGDVVVVEAVLLDPDKGENWQVPFTAVLTIKNGRISEDRTYADWTKWPGVG